LEAPNVYLGEKVVSEKEYRSAIAQYIDFWEVEKGTLS
jgi:hypothetical protein